MSRIGDKLSTVGRVEPVESGAVVGVLPCSLTDPDSQLKAAHKLEAGKSEDKKKVSPHYLNLKKRWQSNFCRQKFIYDQPLIVIKYK